MGGLRGHRRLVVGVIATAVAATTGLMLALGSSGATIATVAVAVATLLVTLIQARAKSVGDDRLLATARQLARKVRDLEADALARLMADSGAVRTAEMSFAQLEPPYWRIDGGDPQGTLSEVAGYYRSLNRGRLVVLGDPGAGKTVLAIRLVLDLAKTAMDTADDTRPLPRVPVRLSLPAFDPGNDAGVATPRVMSDRLDGWLTRHLVTTFGLSTTVAATLVTDGWILPVLDGLDEMDRDDVKPQRAASVIRAVNQFAAGDLRPVVITCRTNRYQQLSGHGTAAAKPLSSARATTSSAGRREVVQDATVVGVEPLTTKSAVDYLTNRFPDPADRRRVESRWRPIVEQLTASNSGDDPLAAALSSPLRLFLTVTAYRHPDNTPDELARFTTTAQLDEHLFARLVPAVLEQHPPAGRQYKASEVTRWLTTLARHLGQQGARGGSPSDLRLDQLWPTAGWRAPRYAATLVTTTAGGTLLAVGTLDRRPLYVLPVLGLAALIVVTAWMALRPRTDLRRLDLSGLRTSTGRRRIGRLLAIGLPAGLTAGLIVAYTSTVVGLMDRLMVVLKFCVLGLVGTLTIGLGSGPTTRPTAIDRPSRLAQQGMVYTIAAMFAVSLTFLLTDKLISGGLSAGVMGQLVAGLGTWLAIGLAIGSTSGLTIGLAAGLAVGLNGGSADELPFAVVALVVGLIFVANSPWPRYLFAVMLLARRGKLPRRPAMFLDWAYEVGLMRLSGIAVQFRHGEFQAWLTNRDQPGVAYGRSY